MEGSASFCVSVVVKEGCVALQWLENVLKDSRKEEMETILRYMDAIVKMSFTEYRAVGFGNMLM